MNDSPSQTFFFDHAWDDFSPVKIVKSLLSEQHDFHGNKSAMAAALSAWTIAPDDTSLRKASISYQVLRDLVAIEEHGRDVGVMDIALSDIYYRIQQPRVSDFYRCIYYPIGGLRAITIDSASDDITAFRLKSSMRIADAVEMMHVLHFHSNYLRTNAYRPASVLKASQLVAEIRQAKGLTGRDVDDRKIRAQWSRFRPSAALLYAASNFMIGSQQSLLQAMVEGSFNWIQHGVFLRKIIGMASFSDTKILRLLYKNKAHDTDFAGLDNVEECQFQPLGFDQREEGRIRRSFRRLEGVPTD